MKGGVLLLLAAQLLSCPTADGQAVKFPKTGSKVQLRVPRAAGIVMKESGYTFHRMELEMHPVLGLLVNGTDRWLFRDPDMRTYTFQKPRKDKKRDTRLRTSAQRTWTVLAFR